MLTAKEARERAAKTAVKEERARDAARAMQEYQAEQLAVRARTERLRALRLAQEAETVVDGVIKKKPKRLGKGTR